ncbi:MULTISPECIES: tetratricopeptide repeat protein [unclassified Coleofasciculus]|uniref:tetratricopeptide repeat protein n=1 Tax=unclassified Coleofasciculus TaxID=2692782 RepID=UPI0018820538|nr:MULTISPECIES: tetratricopeptide repeat protein [unclassified Coleofasciculus]MBE9129993.1 tetratricopeptide repeat protein [Coleofasciculus sp. LEGE 07081]MBE9152220.1 tetratricopeptide repeat protein [Coleofasciculus sp. LEGE 07092]
MTVTDIVPHKVSSWNRQTYQRLKLALSLGLRRQIFVAVCDDLSLRNRLAGKLQGELGATSATDYFKLVSLNINVNEPNLLAQLTQWWANNQQSRSPNSTVGFQILGIERLTRQPPSVQRLFLRRLQTMERHLPRLETTLLLWLPRPWFHTIAQSVPEFWQWHTGIFEFEGEPTPLPPVGASKPEGSPSSPIFAPQLPELKSEPQEENDSVLEKIAETTGSFKEDLRTLLSQDLVETDESAFLNEIIRKYQPPNENSAPLIADRETPTAPTARESSPIADQDGKSIPSSIEDEDGGTKKQGEQSNLSPSLEFPVTSSSESEASPELSSETSSEASPELSSETSSEASPELSSETSSETTSPADAYLQLGNHYRHAIEQGDASEENIAIAIQSYEQALQWIDNASPQIADILNDLGNLYWMLSRCPSPAEHRLSYLEQAIQAYQLALTKLIAEDAPQTYAMVQNNLGAAYGDLARYKDPADSLELSIRAYEEALRYRHADSEPFKYASTQNNLGTAYWHLAQHQTPIENLQAAIGAYAEALCYYNSKSEPMNWAMIQNNLGTAYWNLAQYEQPEIWLELAVLAYKDALNYRTPEVVPAACAATENNLGTAYWHLADRFQEDSERRKEYLQQCIIAYKKAIALTQQLADNAPPIPVTFDVVATRNNLGLAHYQLATEPEFALDEAAKSAHLEAALEQHVKACTSITGQSDAYQTAVSHIIKTIRAFFRKRGIVGQNLALSKVPGHLIPEILPRL